MYFYNGHREQKSEPTLANIFYFLGFNFSLISAVNFYKLNNATTPTPSAEINSAGLSLQVFPVPTLTYTF